MAAPFAWRSTRSRKEIPSCPGVYVVYVNGALMYIGSSTNLKHRAGIHLRTVRSMRSYDYDPPPREALDYSLTCVIKFKPSRKLGDWLMWEYRLIHRLRPCDNRIGVTTARA